MRHLEHPPKISFEDNWMKELGSENSWRWKKKSQQTQPKTKNPIIKHGETCFGRATIRFECSGNRKRVLRLTAKSTNGKNRETCFPVVCQCLLKRLDQDKDADENVSCRSCKNGETR